MDWTEEAGELAVTIRRDRRPDRALDLALAGWAWLEVAGLVALARLGWGGPGEPSIASQVPPVAVAALVGALVLVTLAGLVLIRARLAGAEIEVLRTDSRTLWHEVHGPFESTTRAYPVESLHELRVTRSRRAPAAASRRAWWTEPRLAFEVAGRTARVGRGLDTAGAEEVLEALAPWLEVGEDAAERVVPHGATLVPSAPPELSEGSVRCGRCGTEALALEPHAPVRATATSRPPITWCDGCAAWVETLREPTRLEAEPTARLLSVHPSGDETLLELAPYPSLATWLHDRALTVGLGSAIFAAVSLVAATGPTLPEPAIRQVVIAIAAVSVLLTALCTVAWLVVRRPPHAIRLLADGMRIEWRRGPFRGAVQLAYQRTTAIDVEVERRDRGRAAVRMRMGAVAATVAPSLAVGDARVLAEAVRYHAAHAAWRAGRTPGWVPRLELVCRACGHSIEDARGPTGEAPPAVTCDHCERHWALDEVLTPSLARIALDPESSDDLDVTASPVHGTVLRIRSAMPWRRLGAFVPALALLLGGAAAYRFLPHLGLENLRPWSLVATGLGAALALRAIALATVRAVEVRVNHDTVTVRRVRLLGSTARRIAIGRVAAVERPVRAKGATEDEPRRAAVRLRIRRRLPVPGLGDERLRLGAHLRPAEQRWLAKALDKLILETAYLAPPGQAPSPGVQAAAAVEPVEAPINDPELAPAAADVAPHGSETNDRMHSM